MKTSSLLGVAVVLTLITGVLLLISAWGRNMHMAMTMTTYAQCVEAGFPIVGTYPSQCQTPDGRTFVNPDQQVAPQPQQQPSAPLPTDGAATSTSGGCIIGGCSKELCTDASAGPVMSPCIYEASFACYKTAACERQPDGQCGWTPTPELAACIAAEPSQVTPPPQVQ